MTPICIQCLSDKADDQPPGHLPDLSFYLYRYEEYYYGYGTSTYGIDLKDSEAVQKALEGFDTRMDQVKTHLQTHNEVRSRDFRRLKICGDNLNSYATTVFGRERMLVKNHVFPHPMALNFSVGWTYKLTSLSWHSQLLQGIGTMSANCLALNRTTFRSSTRPFRS